LFVCIFWWLNSKDKSLWFQETGIVRNLWLDLVLHFQDFILNWKRFDSIFIRLALE
jgi:hypothetical protein